MSLASHLHLPAAGEPGPMGRPSTGPILTVYQNIVCDMDAPCGERAQGMASMMGAMGGQPSGGAPKLPRPPGVVYPANASCATCHSEESARNPRLKKCAACKLTQCASFVSVPGSALCLVF